VTDPESVTVLGDTDTWKQVKNLADSLYLPPGRPETPQRINYQGIPIAASQRSR
jgi:hypothetical protein